MTEDAIHKAEMSSDPQGRQTLFSKIGFGASRISRCAVHKNALIRAISNGIKLIDTASNYNDGESEELIGEVLSELQRENIVKREEVQIVSKCGFLCGSNLNRFENAHHRFPDIVEFNPNYMHCIHPDFIKDQISQSLQRLKTPYIDFYLLHNPENYLIKNMSKFHTYSKEDIEIFKKEVLRRIAIAFEFMESLIKEEGTIKSYGISSNTFSVPYSDPHFLPFQETICLAQQAAIKVFGSSSEHHFSMIQLPANLFETEALNHAIPWANKNNINVLVNRPINAFPDKGSWRLADYADTSEEFLLYSRALKQEYSESKFTRVVESLNMAEKTVIGDFSMSLFEWVSYLEGYLYPMIRKAAMEYHLDSSNKAFEKLQGWLDRLHSVAKYKSGLHTREFLMKKLDYTIPDDQTLQQFSIRFLMNSPGVDCVLLGARTEEYVEDALKLL